MELSQRCVLRDGRSVVVLDEGGVACESSPDWERTWVSWEGVGRVEIRAGLREIPPDMLRHTSDTLMLDAGRPRDMVDRIHGRSNHSTTYRHYYRPSPEEMRGALGPYFSGLGDSMGEGSAEGPLPTD